ncbi:MAG: PEGA domain-containing protein, partial [Myxococcota bacterium]
MTLALLETLIILSGVGKAPAHLGPVLDRVAAEVGADARFGDTLARAIDERLSLPAGDPIAARDVAVMREATDSVFRVYAAGDWAPAAETLERLRARIDASPSSLSADVSLRESLYDIRIMLGECYRRLSRDAEANALMAEAIRSDAKREPSTLRFSPDVLDFFKKVKRDLDAQPRGTLEITSEPAGVSVFVGGEFSGQTPVKLGDLYPGRYRVLVGTGATTSRAHDVTVQGDERL